MDLLDLCPLSALILRNLFNDKQLPENVNMEIATVEC